MACALNSSDWVVNSKGRVISRGVTSCAGMTAQHVLLAQTKIGFLTGGRGYNFQELSADEKQSQREEAFARATVAFMVRVCATNNSLVALFLWNSKPEA